MLNAIPLQALFELQYLAPQGDRKFASAASGLAAFQNYLFFISDDELSLNRINLDLQLIDQSKNLLHDPLPQDPKLRKKVKPDWESLCYDPKSKSFLILPSGSRENRNRGFQVLADSTEFGVIQELNLTSLFSVLAKQVEELNLEGACFFQETLHLFQRGNSSRGKNLVIQIPEERFWSCLLQGQEFSSSDFKTTEFVFPLIEGAKLSFTDATSGSNGIYFIASTERTDSTYDDGEYTGSILGSLNAQMKLEWFRYLDCPAKPEGLVVFEEKSSFFVVTDADSSLVPSCLFEGKLPRG